MNTLLKEELDKILPLTPPFAVKIMGFDGKPLEGRLFTVTKKEIDLISGEVLIRVMELDTTMPWDPTRMIYDQILKTN